MDSQNPKKEEPQDADLLKAYAEAAAGTSKLLVSGSIILFILIVIVGQELRKLEGRQEALNQSVLDSQKSLDNTNCLVAAIYTEIQELLDLDVRKMTRTRRPDFQARSRLPLSEFIEVEKRDIPKVPSGRVDYQRDVEALAVKENEIKLTREKIEAIARKERARSSRPNERSPDRAQVSGDASADADKPQLRQTGKADQVESPKSSAKDANPKPDGSGDVPKAKDGAVGEKERPCVLPDNKVKTLTSNVRNPEQKYGEPVEALDDLIRALAKYEELYHESISPRQRLLDSKKESQQLASVKSLPTPFGSFEVEPGLALLALAFAMLIAYFSFHISIRRVRTASDDFRARVPAEKPVDSLLNLTPFWLYGSEHKGLFTAQKVNAAFTKALIFHSIWVLIAGLLVWDSWGRNVVKFLAFEYKGIWNYILIGFLVVAVALLCWQFLSAQIKAKVLPLWTKLRQLLVGEDVPVAQRRAFLVIGITALAGLAFGVAYLRRRDSASIGSDCGIADIPGGTARSELVITPEEKSHGSQKGGRVHHRRICKKHLTGKEEPVEKSAVAKSAIHLRIHAGWAPQILIACAEDLLKPAAEKKAKLKHAPKEQVDGLKKEIAAYAGEAITLLESAIQLNPFAYRAYDQMRRAYALPDRHEHFRMYLNKKLKELEERENQKNFGGFGGCVMFVTGRNNKEIRIRQERVKSREEQTKTQEAQRRRRQKQKKTPLELAKANLALRIQGLSMRATKKKEYEAERKPT